LGCLSPGREGPRRKLGDFLSEFMDEEALKKSLTGLFPMGYIFEGMDVQIKVHSGVKETDR